LDDDKVKDEPGIGATKEDESPSSHLNIDGYTKRQSAARNSDEEQEPGSVMDREENPHHPLLDPSPPPQIAMRIVIHRMRIHP
ncbi:hypothetical protein PHMEG_0006992, partial [Phytophthora megakarya]